MSHHRKKSSRSVILGGSFLKRARIVFLFSFLSVIALLSLSIYNSSKSGAIQNNVIAPVKKAARSLLDTLSENPSNTKQYENGQVNVQFQYSVVKPSATPSPKETEYYYESSYGNNYYESAYAPVKSFEESVSENNKWFEEQKAANEKWFQEKSAANKSSYDEAVKKMNDDYNADVQKMNEDLEAWKKEHGF